MFVSQFSRLAVVAFAALAAATAARAEEVFQVKQIHIGEQTVTVMIYQGQSYRRISADELSDARLAGQTVCLEGKLRSAGLDGVQIFGVEQKFEMSGPEIFKGFSPGDNVWLGGRLERVENRQTFKVTRPVRLKSDLELFDERYQAGADAGDWRRLVELAGWIERSKDYNPQIPYEEHRKYRNCRVRAVAKARSSAEVAFGDRDAEGYAELAGLLSKLGGEEEAAYGYLQRAAEIDPELQSATRRLTEAGFVRVMGRYVTVEEKKTIEAAETERVNRSRSEARARQERAAEDAVVGAAGFVRNAFELDAAIAALGPADAAARLAAAIELTVDPRLARRALVLSLGQPVKLQSAVLAAAAAHSREAAIRMAALEIAAMRRDLAGRKLIREAAARDSVPEVIELACSLLGAAGDADAMGLLVELASSGTEPRARLAGQALRKVAREERYTKAEWALWWKRNRESFPAGPSE